MPAKFSDVNLAILTDDKAMVVNNSHP